MKITLTTANGIKLALSNLIPLGDGATVYDIKDTIEDAIANKKSAKKLASDLNGLHLLGRFSESRETESYIRLLCTDPFGNKEYMTIWR